MDMRITNLDRYKFEKNSSELENIHSLIPTIDNSLKLEKDQMIRLSNGVDVLEVEYSLKIEIKLNECKGDSMTPVYNDGELERFEISIKDVYLNEDLIKIDVISEDIITSIISDIIN